MRGGDRGKSGRDSWGKEIGIHLVKRMGEGKDVYGRKGCVGWLCFLDMLQRT